MAVQIATSTGPAQLLRNYWQQQLLGILENTLLAYDLCDKQVIPANSGRVIEFRRINTFKKQMAGISSFLGYATFAGLKGATFSVDSVVYGLQLIGNDLEIDEQSIMCGEPNPIPTLTERFLYNAKDSLDQFLINVAVSNDGNTQSSTAPSVTYFGNSVSTPTTWGDGSQTLTEATLDGNNPSHRVAAESFNSIYTALKSRSARFPRGRQAFPVLCSPEISGDLRTDGTFQDIALKGNMRGEDKFERARVGTVFGCDILEDENVGVQQPGTINASTDEIVRCPTFGDGYVACVNHAKGVGRPSVNFIPPSQPDKNDPYGLVGIMTWKMWIADGGVLNPLAGQLLKVATTRLKNVAQNDDQGTWG